MVDVRYNHSFIICKDSCDLTFLLISTLIFEASEAKISLQNKFFKQDVWLFNKIRK